MKVAYSIPSVSTGTGIDPVATEGDIIEFNRRAMTLTGSNGSTVNIDEVIDIINTDTYYHKITASKVGAATLATSDIATLGSAYGIVAGYTPFSAEINGVTVNFTTTTSGSVAYGDPVVADLNDMVLDINNAAIPNIEASIQDGTMLVLRNTSGGSIDLVNITTDANGNNFAGANSLSSLPLTTPENTSTFALRLERADGGPLTIRDVQGSFLSTAGVMSGQTGRFALGLNIEQGLRSSKTSVVANIAARDALYPIVGDQAHVLDAGNSEWAIFVFDGSEWQEFGNKRSKETDARTLVLEFDLSNYSSGANTVSIGEISQGRTVKDVKVLVTSACPSDAEITVGTSSDTSCLFAARDARLTETGSYTVDCDYRINSFTEIVAELTITTLGSGQVTIILTYV
jgi:hypothetical protein